MLRTRILASLFSAIILTPISASALVIVGDLPIRLAEDIEIVDGLAYVVSASFPGSGVPTLRILDLAIPSSPVEIGSLDAAVGGAEDVEVVGGLAFITDAFFGGSLRIIDVSNPAAPIEIGTFASEFKAIDVEVVENIAYLVDQFFVNPCGSLPCGSALRVIDVSDPTEPFQISETFIFFTSDMEAAEGVVYLAGNGLEVVDVSNPEMPTTVGVLPENVADDIELVGEHVYTAFRYSNTDPSTGPPGGLEIVNVMDSTNPISVGRELVLGSSIEVVGEFAYTGGIGMDVVDVSNVSAPTRRGSIYSGLSNDVAVYGGHAYLAGQDGLKIVDLSIQDTPVEVGAAVAEDSSSHRWLAYDVAVSGDAAYLAVGDLRVSAGGLRIFDVTDPRTPAAIGGVDTASSALDVELKGEFAYVAADVDGLRIFNVANPSAATGAGGLALAGSTAKVAVIGEIAYVVDRGTRAAPVALRVVDVSEPSAPTEMSVVELTSSGFRCLTPGIAVVEKLAYVTCSGFFIIDVSDPADPTLIYSSRRAQYWISSIDVEEGLAYIGSHDSISVFDVSNPAEPVEISSADDGGSAILVQNGFAYSAGRWGLAVHDVEEPLHPVLMGGFPAERGDWRGLELANGLIYGATGSGGLQIVDLGPEYTRLLPVEIAIRGDGESGAVNLASRGVIPVAVLGAPDFDVTEIDRSTLRFAPASATPAHKIGGHLDDVNGDGHLDLVSHFRIQESGISETDEKACVTGQTFSETPFEGCSAIDPTLPRGRINAL
ncbi:MAG: hypothetical protein IH881_19885 [Myxococcales bacterium]|nr:hypothetical protein [Myxococcales bacterium]